MATEKKNLFLTKETDKDLTSSLSGVFGLNHRAQVTTLEFTDKGGKDKNQPTINLGVTIEDREYKAWLDLTEGRKLFVKGELAGPDADGYEDALYRDLKQKIAVVRSFLLAVKVPMNTLDAVCATAASEDDIIEGFKIIVNAAPDGFHKKYVDVFLEYQSKIRQGQKSTYLELPSNMNYGIFICAAVKPEGEWKENLVEGTSLTYVDDKGNVHPITKSKTFLASKKASQQTEDDTKGVSRQTRGASASTARSTASTKPAAPAEETEDEDWGDED